MGMIDGGMAGVFASVMGTFFLDAVLHRATNTDDGAGGGSVSFTNEAVKAQVDQITQAQRDGGHTDKDHRILVLASGVDTISIDDEITVDGRRWSIASVSTDPARAYYDLVGRLSANAPHPSWVPATALVVSDFENDLYWRQDIGVCALADVWEEGLPSWGTFDPVTDVVAGQGLTTGVRTGTAAKTVAPVLTAGADALLGDVFAADLHFDLDAASVTGGFVGVTVNRFGWPDGITAGPSLLIYPYVDTGGQHIWSYAWDGAGHAQDVLVSGTFDRVAFNVSTPAGDVIASHNGAAVAGVITSGDFSGIEALGIAAAVVKGGQAYSAQATVTRLTLYPAMDQAALNALSGAI